MKALSTVSAQIVAQKGTKVIYDYFNIMSRASLHSLPAQENKRRVQILFSGMMAKVMHGMTFLLWIAAICQSVSSDWGFHAAFCFSKHELHEDKSMLYYIKGCSPIYI